MKKKKSIYYWILLSIFVVFVLVLASSFYVYHIAHSHDHMSSDIPKAGSLSVDIWESITGKNPEQVICYRESHRNFYFFCFYLLLLVLVLIGLGLFAQRRYSSNLLKKNEEIARQALQIQQTHNELVSGLRYAGMVQKAFLPNESDLSSLIAEKYWLSFFPKDEVSGDFYLIQKTGPYTYYCLGDCTGHGISAGFLSVTFIQLLKVLIEHFPNDPAAILYHLAKEIQSLLKDSPLEDGLTLSLACIAADGKLIYASAKQDAWMLDLKQQRITDIKGSNLGLSKVYEIDENSFQNQSLTLDASTVLILHSDGLTDQFGEVTSKKLGKKGIKQSVEQRTFSSAWEAGKHIENTWLQWKGKHAQVDDMCFMAIPLEKLSG